MAKISPKISILPYPPLAMNPHCNGNENSLLTLVDQSLCVFPLKYGEVTL